MRMYLSSFRTGDHPDEMLALLTRTAATPDVAVIANAVDVLPDEERRAAVEREFEALAGLGLRPSEVDLRTFFDQPSTQVATALSRFPLIWVRGGNVFVLRQALARSGADLALTELLRQDAFVYAGYSAGVCVLAPDLHGLEQCDDPKEVRTAYGDEARWDGLGLLDHVVVPHIDSPGHPESEILGAVADRYHAEGTAHRPLRDGQALVIDGDRPPRVR
ncbi:Type 1 glutamine amidotransferase-like domain-containing protein [Streptomyces sp. JH34]|uniref:Type 1 glutamine amidotransferase-like domain-containing protein n=1 Tax=Streptomyces sp. JH34 TaxID=2793633 RepID=UPI0023FA0018|nr:Type 1 glutamine amidotransferase-like domain-containing protein [Streptomyces sp. JH34]MDF6017192.1 peptidase E [Streptomyces sp. JH34]